MFNYSTRLLNILNTLIKWFLYLWLLDLCFQTQLFVQRTISIRIPSTSFNKPVWCIPFFEFRSLKYPSSCRMFNYRSIWFIYEYPMVYVEAQTLWLNELHFCKFTFSGFFFYNKGLHSWSIKSPKLWFRQCFIIDR